MSALWLSIGVIFLAELGDKSQLMALAFASRFRARDVLIGITVATAIVHAASVLIGHVAGNALPTSVVNIVAGVAFLLFAIWTMRGDTLNDDESKKARRTKGAAIIAVSSAFFLAELGDKTMLATITLAADRNVWGVWIGSTVGMVAADALAILAGSQLARMMPERIIKIVASVLFVAFGLILIFEGVTG